MNKKGKYFWIRIQKRTQLLEYNWIPNSFLAHKLHFWRQIMQTIRFLPEWCWRTCHHRMMRNWKSELRERLTQFRHWENSIRSNDFHSFDIKLNYFVFHDFKLCDLAWHVERCRNKPQSSGTLHWIADSAMRKACEKGRKNKQTNKLQRKVALNRALGRESMHCTLSNLQSVRVALEKENSCKKAKSMQMWANLDFSWHFSGFPDSNQLHPHIAHIWTTNSDREYMGTNIWAMRIWKEIFGQQIFGRFIFLQKIFGQWIYGQWTFWNKYLSNEYLDN